MGISSNQARFLALTSRQVDLEFRVQQICQRRLRLSSELENVATSYNNSISNRNLYTMNTSNSGISHLTVANITALKDTNSKPYTILSKDSSGLNATTSGKTLVLSSQATAATFQTAVTNKATDGNSWVCSSNGTTAASAVLKIGGSVYTLADLGLTVGAKEENIVEAALRAGVISIAQEKDEFTQSPTTASDNAGAALATQYELKDWRTLPAIADELYAGDDVDAENKYDKTVAEINAQDKKLQLEQTSIEVEYKAVTSEKESVKKILDTNAQASFKYFS